MPRAVSLLPLLLLLLPAAAAASDGSNKAEGPDPPRLVPVAPATAELGAVAALGLLTNGTAAAQRRRLEGSFQLCAPCTCCAGGARGGCVLAPCCYAINCNIPNRPFGYCSFTPKSCDCLTCKL